MRQNFNKTVKMHEACSSDSSWKSNIFFNNGYAYATNGYIIIKNSIDEISNFDDNQKQLLNNKSLHRNQYKDILKYDSVNIIEDGIECIDPKSKGKILFNFSENTCYIDFEKTINIVIDAEPISLEEIHFDTSLITNINNALFNSEDCKFQFKRQIEHLNRVIVLVKSSKNSLAIMSTNI